MNNAEARTILRAHLDTYRARPHTDLARLIEHQPEPLEMFGASGSLYQVEVLAVWDSAPGSAIRILGSIDDGGWRAFIPLSEDFIMRPDGSFVDG